MGLQQDTSQKTSPTRTEFVNSKPDASLHSAGCRRPRKLESSPRKVCDEDLCSSKKQHSCYQCKQQNKVWVGALSRKAPKKGFEVKFQRNTPSVLDRPIVNEADEDPDADYSSSGSDIRDHHFPMGVHTLNKPMFQSSTPFSSAKSINRGTKRDVHSITWTRKPAVDLSKLGMNSLRRYCLAYNISGINSDSTREQVLRAVEQHFVSQPPLDEVQVIRELLIHGAKEPKNKNIKQER